ncbi:MULTISPECIES: ATP-binding protein [unclassified Streptomyces]|uniref:ATP-binding protein n=1 Tax=unclassified Streptomyces TaxID=2593676 RepID=UPI002E8202AB|nr:ATP-binding protein [Streptomyces sp. NBC_00562]WTC77242.1 ATP-binding protein [Streptomyces sp. NBC_01653]WTD93619.1 ATP-binding protein [Streptomyces sp. NBC_01637]WUC24577.1 ATP-binding protein [Streptomyces sp. NBC_00562]
MAAQDAALGKAGVSEGAPLSWFARQLALWSRVTEPLQPLGAPRARATARDASWPLASELISVSRARRMVVAQVGEWGLNELADTVELLVSELVTNALCHARGPVRLNLQVRGSHLRCEVEDTNSEGPVRRTVCADAEGGRGMELLDLLAESWGSSSTATGKTLWFELPLPVPAQTCRPGGL